MKFLQRRKYRAEVMKHVLNLLLTATEEGLLKLLPGIEEAIAQNFTGGVSPGDCAVMIATGVLNRGISSRAVEERSQSLAKLGDKAYHVRVFDQLKDPDLMDDEDDHDTIAFQIIRGALIINEMKNDGEVNEHFDEMWLDGAEAALKGLTDDEMFGVSMLRKFDELSGLEEQK